MKIRQAPVADLMKYMSECYSHTKDFTYEHIFDVLDEYYCKLTNHRSILPIEGLVFQDWCDMNYSHTMINCPNVPGIIIYKKLKDGSTKYGILYHSGYQTKGKQTGFLSYYTLDVEGHISSHIYLQEDWDGWGAPVRFFAFDQRDYVESNQWYFGERTLELNMFGHDVMMFQTLLARVYPELPITKVFDTATLKIYNNIQTIANLPITNSFDVKSVAGRKFLAFIMHGRQC